MSDAESKLNKVQHFLDFLSFDSPWMSFIFVHKKIWTFFMTQLYVKMRISPFNVLHLNILLTGLYELFANEKRQRR